MEAFRALLSFLKSLFFGDFWLKLFSFALAVLMWFIIYFARDVSPGRPSPWKGVPEKRTIQMPVDVLWSAEDVRAYVRVYPKEVQVTVQGDPRAVKALQRKDLRVLVDLTGIGGAHDLRKRIEVTTPSGITYLGADPDEVQVVFSTPK